MFDIFCHFAVHRYASSATGDGTHGKENADATRNPNANYTAGFNFFSLPIRVEVLPVSI